MKNNFKTPDPKKAKRYFARKLAFTTAPLELSRWLKERKDIKILDVRDFKSFAKGHLPGAINLPEDRWQKTSGFDKGKTYIIYSESPSCRLAARAAFELASQGYPVIELDGGFEAWKTSGQAIQKRPIPRPPVRSKPSLEPPASAEEMAPSEEEVSPIEVN